MSASTSPAFSSSPTMRHSEMAGTLAGARLCRHVVRPLTFAGSSSPPLIGTPPLTSPTIISPHAARPDQPRCVIHPACVMSVLVVRTPSLSTEGCRCFASSGSSGATCGLLRCCFLTAADHVHDLVVDYASLRALRVWSSSSHSSSSSSPLSIAGASPGSSGLALENLGYTRFVASVAITSSPSNSRRRHLLPCRSSAPATAMEVFSAGPPPRRRLVVHPPLHVRYWQHRCVPIVHDAFSSLANPGMYRPMARLHQLRHRSLYDCLDASPSSSMASSPWRLLVRPRLHVRLPRLRQPRQLHVDHGYPMHGIFNHGSSPFSSATSTSTQRATIRMSYSPVFSPVAASAPHRHYDCGGMLVRWLLLSASSPVSPSAVLPL